MANSHTAEMKEHLNSFDFIRIHDLSPDNGDMGERWREYFEVAAKGAMPELTRMREVMNASEPSSCTPTNREYS